MIGDDGLTAVTRRPSLPRQRQTRALAFFVGLTTALGWGGTFLAWRDLRARDAELRAAVQVQLDTERAARAAAVRGEHAFVDYQGQRIDALARDVIECYGAVTLP